MGILNQLTGQIKGKLGLPQADDEPQGPPGGLLEAVVALASSTGGLSGLLQQLRDSGLQEQVASWIGLGENQPVSAGQIHSALGEAQVSDIALHSGVPTEQAAASLAQFLPKLIDQLTPNGQIPSEDNWQSEVGNLIEGHLFGGGKDSH
ncbi:YidB family protein [Actimicrobium antarcticum]|uniref:DUF937 domain-containing protein n=1 Tax=Actimicrobium antarcticum TaxID=1051899 RepID=A0ABP7TJS3_9BURK